MLLNTAALSSTFRAHLYRPQPLLHLNVMKSML